MPYDAVGDGHVANFDVAGDRAYLLSLWYNNSQYLEIVDISHAEQPDRNLAAGAAEKLLGNQGKWKQ